MGSEFGCLVLVRRAGFRVVWGLTLRWKGRDAIRRDAGYLVWSTRCVSNVGYTRVLTSSQNFCTHCSCSCCGSSKWARIFSSPSCPARSRRALTTASQSGSPSNRHLPCISRASIVHSLFSTLTHVSSSAGFTQCCVKSAFAS